MASNATSKTEGANLPQWIRLLPRGQVELLDSRQPFEVDQESLDAMVKDFASRGVDLVIDYEHQSLKGERAPAAGWIKELEAREDGLWARVEWTTQAQEYLRQREYRYFSPVLRLSPETRKPAVLMQVGLTNVPAIKHLPPLVARWGGQPPAAQELLRDGREDKDRMRNKIECLVGLTPEAKDEVVWGKVLEAFQDLAGVLELPEDASVSQVKGAVVALRAGGERLAEVQGELNTLKARLAEQTAARSVEEALKAGKVSPAQTVWAEEYCRRDPEGFKTYVTRAPKLVPTGEELRLLVEDLREAGQLLPEDLAICRALNLVPQEYLKAKAQISGAQ